jgi:MoxR-like ATPase
MPSDLQSKFIALAKEVNKRLLERKEEVDILLTCLLLPDEVGMDIPRNCTLIGAPGTAKSAVLKRITSAIACKYFHYQIQPTTPPEALFGSISIKKLTEEDVVRHNTAGMLPQAEIAFLDEIWNGPRSVLPGLLEISLEKQFSNGGQVDKCPLWMIVSAANVAPVSDDPNDENVKALQAVWDRFLFRKDVKRLSDSAREKLIRRKLDRSPIPRTLTMDDIKRATEEVRAVAVPDEITDAYVRGVRNLLDAGIVPSDRRVDCWKGIVQAFAYLKGRDEAELGDVMIMKHVLWNNPKDALKCQTTLATALNPETAEVEGKLASAEEIYERIENLGKSVTLSDYRDPTSTEKETYRKSMLSLVEVQKWTQGEEARRAVEKDLDLLDKLDRVEKMLIDARSIGLKARLTEI